MAYSKKPTYSFPDINSTGINKIPQGRIITVDDYFSGKPKMFLTEDLSSLNDSSTIQDAIVQGKLIENQVISSDVTPIGVYKNVENKTIGASGDFKTIQEAFTYAQTHQKQALAQKLKLTLLQDFNQELYFHGAWYPHLIINCNGFTLGKKTVIDMSCFTIENLKLNDNIIISNSIFWFSGNNININYQNENYGRGCITALGATFLYINASNIALNAISSKSGIVAQGNSQIALITNSTITQTTGANCFACYTGGTIMLNPTLNLNGITIPKANQTANTITNNGLIIGNYYSI